jgi:hypothetical protein
VTVDVGVTHGTLLTNEVEVSTGTAGDPKISRCDSPRVLQTDPPDGYRIGLDDGVASTGEFKVGDVIAGVRGPLHYSYGNWKVESPSPGPRTSCPAVRLTPCALRPR